MPQNRISTGDLYKINQAMAKAGTDAIKKRKEQEELRKKAEEERKQAALEQSKIPNNGGSTWAQYRAAREAGEVKNAQDFITQRDTRNAAWNKVGADTLENDMNALSQSISTAYGDALDTSKYYTQEQLNASSNQVKQIRDRLKALQDYYNTYGGTDEQKKAVGEQIKAYDSEIKFFGDLANHYGSFKNEADFNYRTDKRLDEDYIVNEYDTEAGKKNLEKIESSLSELEDAYRTLDKENYALSLEKTFQRGETTVEIPKNKMTEFLRQYMSDDQKDKSNYVKIDLVKFMNDYNSKKNGLTQEYQLESFALNNADRMRTAAAYKKLSENQDFLQGIELGQSVTNPSYQDFANYEGTVESLADAVNHGVATDGQYNQYVTLTQNPISIRNRLSFRDDVMNNKYGGIDAARIYDYSDLGDEIVNAYSYNYDMMTEDEKNTYYYLLGTQGVDAANKYLEDMKLTLDFRNTEQVKKYIEDIKNSKEFGNISAAVLGSGSLFGGGLLGAGLGYLLADKNEGINKAAGDVVYSAASVPLNVLGGGISTIGEIGQRLSLASKGDWKGKGYNPYENYNLFSVAGREARGLVAKDIEDSIGWEMFGQNVMSQVYQSLMSGVDSAFGMATLGKLYTISMGGSAAASKAAELYESGASSSQIYWESLLSGIAEATFEYLSIENLSSIKSIVESKPTIPKKAIKMILTQNGVEASEEVFTEIANMVIDKGIKKYDSDYDRKVTEYVRDGMTREEAVKKAAGEVSADIGWAGAGGFISGLASSSLTIAGAYRAGKANADAQISAIDPGNTEGLYNNAKKIDYSILNDASDALKKGDAKAAAEIISEGKDWYEYLKSYAKEKYGKNQASEISANIDASIDNLNQIKNLISSGKINADSIQAVLEKAKSAQDTKVDVTSANDEKLFSLLAKGELSNKDIERNILKDRQTLAAFERLTGTKANGTTISQKRASVRQTLDIIKNSSDTLKAAQNAIESGATATEGHKNAAVIIDQAIQANRAENSRLRNSEKVKSAETKAAIDATNRQHRFLETVRNYVINGGDLSGFTESPVANVSGDGGNNSSEAKTTQETTKKRIRADFSAYQDERYSAENASALANLNSKAEQDAFFRNENAGIEQEIKNVESSDSITAEEKAQRIGELKEAASRNNSLAKAMDDFREMGRLVRAGEVDKVVDSLRKPLKKMGVNIEVVDNVEAADGMKSGAYFDKSTNTIKVSRDWNGVENVVKLELAADGNGFVLNSGKSVSFDRAVTQTVAHEIAHADSGLTLDFIKAVAGTQYDAFDLKGRLEHPDDRSWKSEDAQKEENWRRYVDAYTEQAMLEMKGTEEQRRASAEKVVNDAYIFEEIMADMFGAAVDDMGHSSKAGENIFWAMNRNKPGIIKRILNALERFIARIRGKDAYLAVEQRQAAERLRDMLTGELKRAYGTDVKGEAAVENDGGKKYSIVYLDDGKTYVTASRNVISGNDVNQWRKQITNFFNALLEGNKSINIETVEGDTLTITKKETARKARDNFKQENGKPVRMSDNEFRVKLNVEAHIDEIAETARSSKNTGSADTKSHAFAKDGFTYRTAYFEDFNGDYYRVRLSIGNNGTVATVYNVGKMTKDVPASAKILAVVGSKPLAVTSSDNRISQDSRNVNRQFSEISDAKTIEYGGTVENESGEFVAESDGNGGTRWSLSTYESSGRETLRQYLEGQVSETGLTEADAKSVLDSMDDIYEICRKYEGEYAPFGAWSRAEVVIDEKGNPVFSVVKPNGEYAMNLDFSLVCKKRRALDAVLNRLIETGAINDFGFGQEEIVRVNEIIREHGFEIACDMCFVDAKRYRQAGVADQFVDLYNSIVKSMAKDWQEIDYFNFANDSSLSHTEGGIDRLSDAELDFSEINEITKPGAKKTVEYRVAQYLKTHPSDRKLLSRGDFMSTAGFDAVKVSKPDILKLYNSKKGTGGPKAAQSDVQYLNDILSSKKFNRSAAYDVGGVRVQSFSDYVPRLVFDYVQMIGDLAAKRLPAHAYTKEPLFAKQFGLTGMKINMSLMPAKGNGKYAGLNADGSYAWARESFPAEEAFRIQADPEYGKNVGTIAVGISDEHIWKMLSDPDIRMVIPYHKSGINPAVAVKLKIGEYTDYTGQQNTRRKDGKQLTKAELKNIPDINRLMHRDGLDAVEASRRYVEWCEDNGYIPKFEKFAYMTDSDGSRVFNENYYKLLEDFTTMVDGEFHPQGDVTATFPGSDSAFGSMADLIKEGLEEDAVTANRLNGEVDGLAEEVRSALGREESGKRFSLARANDEYMKAVESGNVEEQQRLVDEAAKNAGYDSPKVFHQTGERFWEFKTDNPVAGAYDSETPNGIFFKSNDHDIGVGGNYVETGRGGEIQMAAYLRMENTLHFSNRKEANAWYVRNVPGYEAAQTEMQKAVEPLDRQIDALDDEFFVNDSISEEEYDRQWNGLIEKLRETENEHRKRIREILDDYFLTGNSGYDSIELDYDGHRYIDGKRENVHTYIVFDGSQVKSADTVTYDNDGNVIPLSDRFDSGKKDIRWSISRIVGEDGTDYGNGVVLDSALLENLTDSERKEMVREYVKELGGQTFTAFDENGDETEITIVPDKRWFKNKNGKRVPANKDLAVKNNSFRIKQEAITLIDELIETSGKDGSAPAKYPHDWLDNNGKNNWEYWTTYIQDKNNTVWKARLNVAVSQNGERILYDIAPIKKVGQRVKSRTIPTSNSISQNAQNVNSQESENISVDERHSVVKDEQKSVKTLINEKAKLKQKVADLRQELHLTHGRKLSRDALLSNIAQLADRYGSKITPDALYKDVTELYDRMYNKKVNGKRVERVETQLIVDQMDGIVDAIIENATERNTDYDEYRGLLTQLRKTKLIVPLDNRADAASAAGYDSWAAFRKANFGRVGFVNEGTDGGIAVDTVYQELSETFPELFPDSITHPGEQAAQIADVARTVRDEGIVENPLYDIEDQRLRRDMASSIVDMIGSTEKLDTFADKAAQKEKDARLGERIYYGGKIAELKRKQAERVKRIREHYAESKAARSEKQKVSVETRKILRKVNEFKTELARSTTNRHITEALKTPLTEFLASVDIDNGKNKARAKTYTELQNLLYKAKNDIEQSLPMGGDELADTEMNVQEKQLIARSGVLEDMLAWSEKNGSRPISEMSSAELHELNTILNKANKLTSEIKKLYNPTSGLMARSRDIQNEINLNVAKERSQRMSAPGATARGAKESVFYGHADAASFYNSIGSEEFTKQYEGFRGGQDKFGRNIAELTALMSDAVGESGISEEWHGKKAKEITLELSKGTLRATPAQLMTVYLYLKQEDSRACLMNENGGAVIGAFKAKAAKDAGDISTDGQTFGTAVKGFLKTLRTSSVFGVFSEQSKNPLVLTEADEARIIAALNEQAPGATEVADKLSKILNGKAAQLGNEVSMAMYGYKKYTTDSYFPMRVYETGKPIVLDPKTEMKRLDPSFTKERTHYSGKALIVEDVFDVVGRHLTGMAQYNAFAQLLDEATRMYTVRIKGGKSLKQTLIEQYGNEANDFYRNLLNNLSGAAIYSAVGSEALSERLLSNYKAAAVAKNLSVVFKQPMSIFRAMPEFTSAGWKAWHSIKDLSPTQVKAEMNEMLEHSGIAKLKNWGASENMTKKSFEELYNEPKKNLLQRFNDKLDSGAEFADMWTWSRLWRMSKAEIDATGKYVEGSSEYFEAVNRKFSEVIGRTQVVQSALDSSMAVQNAGQITKFLFAFQNEPLKQFSYLSSAINDVKRGKKGAKAKLAKVVGMSAVNTVFTSAISTLFSWLRGSLDRDDDDEIWDDLLSSFGENVISDILSGGLAPIWWAIEPVMSAVESGAYGNEVERMDVAALTNLGGLINKYLIEQSGGRFNLGTVQDIINAASNLFGLSWKNAARDIKTVFDRVVLGTGIPPKVKYNYLKAWKDVELTDKSSVTKAYYEIVEDAVNRGRYEDYVYIKRDMIYHGYTETKINNAVKKSKAMDELYELKKSNPGSYKAKVNNIVSKMSEISELEGKEFKSLIESAMKKRENSDGSEKTDKELKEEKREELEEEIKERMIWLNDKQRAELVKELLEKYSKYGFTEDDIEKIRKKLAKGK